MRKKSKQHGTQSRPGEGFLSVYLADRDRLTTLCEKLRERHHRRFKQAEVLRIALSIVSDDNVCAAVMLANGSSKP